jgi:S-DNA-T family DNA segregation ATPase FtsK/SpoIIIE
VQEIPLNKNPKHDVELKEFKVSQNGNIFSPSNQMIEDVNSIYAEELKRKFGDGEVTPAKEDGNHIPPVVINHELYSANSDMIHTETQNTSHVGMSSESTHDLDSQHNDYKASTADNPKPTNAKVNESNDRKNAMDSNQDGTDEMLNISQVVEEKKYEFPPINLLGLPKAAPKGIGDRDLKETAMKLQKTLESFGVRVTITNASCGPAVTRYELQPEQGVKVSRITALADDIKLNLAAADIRIEAPIPGKAAVGIEVPNKENSAVMLRELLETKEFTSHPSDIAFAVGKDIGGQAVVTDIAKMPHLLIAGATGSGKSVCINTLIMSILYKANPADVRLIMVDPKVVELSVYNGIPHLLVPVVTDPKKASGALNWAVMEMTDRYKKFADLGVRDLKGYNERVKEVEHLGDANYQKLPQIVIIVDELADLMMVAPGEVEDAICRLAQMARAAGLHLIIATQRPSVNVITGLIKANVPSRIAFSVSSAIDSRTIIDGSGAEKLLGKGDMLFFPSGYPKPVRVQGAFVSDKEVSAVVDFLKSQGSQHSYSDEISNKISAAQSVSPSGSQNANERDDYFIEAGKFIIDKDKASIGMLQRVYKIGFNRAARIMEQLADAGVVGPEEGTKPRKILMSLEEFEQYVDEYV